MTPPVISAFYAALCALLYIWLTFRVVANRGRARVSLGDGGDEGLMKAVRGHANAAEQMPITLIMLALAEMLGAPAVAIHLLGLGFLAGRTLHALHFTMGAATRASGMVISVAATTLLAIGLLVHAAAQLA